MKLNLAVYIKELLFKHDIVCLPGIGSFINAYQSAFVDLDNYSFTPPLKKIVFNSSLNVDDKVLVQYIAEKERITTTEASAFVKTLVYKMETDLNKNKPVLLKDFGVLRRGIDGNFFFVDNAQDNFLDDAYGLMPFDLKTERKPEPRIVSKTVVPTPAPISQPKQTVNNQSKHFSSEKKHLEIPNLVIFVLAVLFGVLMIFYAYLLS